MELCSYEHASSLNPCASVEEVYNCFDNPYTYDIWREGVYSPITRQDVEERLEKATRNFQKISEYRKLLGGRAYEVCLVHNNPDNIPLNQGFPQIYRSHQPESAINRAKLSPTSNKPNIAVPTTIVMESQQLDRLLISDTPTSTTPVVDVEGTLQQAA